MQKDENHITLVLADDHPVVLKGLREEIGEDPALCVEGEAGDGTAALELIRRFRPQVAVLDVAMPGLSGLEVASRIRAEQLPVSVIILTVYDDEEIFSKAIELGVMGYMLKDSAVLDIVRGIKRVARGDYFISPAMSGSLIRSSPGNSHSAARRLGLDTLTAAERRILRLIAADKSTKEIAEELHLSPRTVNSHRSNISVKLKLSGSFSLLRFALENREQI